MRGDIGEIVALAAAGRISVTRPVSRRDRLDRADEAYRRAIVVM